jgi:hypothetical protein
MWEAPSTTDTANYRLLYGAHVPIVNRDPADVVLSEAFNHFGHLEMSEAQGGHKSTLRGILSTRLPHSQMEPEWACIPVHVYLADVEDQAADPHQLWVQCRRRHRHYRLVAKEVCWVIAQFTRVTQGDRIVDMVKFSWSVAQESPSTSIFWYILRGGASSFT